MEIHSYNQELAIANSQFKRLFNNISVIKRNEEIPFKCVIGNRSRIFKNLENPEKNGEYTLPMIIIQRTGITKNSDRLTNINNEVKYSSHSKRINYDLYTPVPIDINYEVTFVSKYPDDIDRALGNIIPFFNKDVFVRQEHPKFDGLFLKCQVIMDDSITEEHPDELGPEVDDVVVCRCQFVFKTWIFCGNNVASSKNNKVRHILSVQHIVDPKTGRCEYVSSIVDTQYDGFIPQVRQVNCGFYPVPLLSSYVGQIELVDSLKPNGIDDSPYVDRLIWKIDESGNGNMIQVSNDYFYTQFSSDYVSSYYDVRRTVVSGEPYILSDQLSTYNYLSGPDEKYLPLPGTEC